MQRRHGRARGDRTAIRLGAPCVRSTAHGLQIGRSLGAGRGPVVQRELHCIQDCMVVQAHIRHIEEDRRKQRKVNLERGEGVRIHLNHLNCTAHPTLNNVRMRSKTVYQDRIIIVLVLEAQIKLAACSASDRAHLVIVGRGGLGADKTEGNGRH